METQTPTPMEQRQQAEKERAEQAIKGFNAGRALGTLEKATAREGKKVSLALLGALEQAAFSGNTETAQVSHRIILNAQDRYADGTDNN